MTQLNQNTADLQSILDSVNALPEAGGGGSPTVSVNITVSISQDNAVLFYDADGTEHRLGSGDSGLFDVLGGIVVVAQNAYGSVATGNYREFSQKQFDEFFSSYATTYCFLEDGGTLTLSK